jgi:hypothetical protein
MGKCSVVSAGRGRSDQREAALGRDACGTVGVGVSWITSKGRSRSDQGQRSGGRDARGAVRVGMCWVAGEGCGRCRGRDES